MSSRWREPSLLAATSKRWCLGYGRCGHEVREGWGTMKMLDSNTTILLVNLSGPVELSTRFPHAVWAFSRRKCHKVRTFCPLSQQRAISQRRHDTESGPTVLSMWGIMELITSTVHCREPLQFFFLFCFFFPLWSIYHELTGDDLLLART